jgi:hypothetical protein
VASTTTHEITITPALNCRGERLAGRFDGRLGRTVIVRGAATPFYASARALLAAGLAASAGNGRVGPDLQNGSRVSGQSFL